MTTILDYLYKTGKEIKMSEASVRALGTITRAKREAIIRLHNLTDLWFYQTKSTAYELRIDFDPKKWDTTNFEYAHKYVKNTFYLQKHISYVMMREWGTAGGRLHYHGIILIHDNNNQTYMAKMKHLIKNHFGRRSQITFITYPESYIPYMYKRFLVENELRMNSEIISSYPICSEALTSDTPIPQKYTEESLIEYQKQRSEKTHLKNPGIYRKSKK